MLIEKDESVIHLEVLCMHDGNMLVQIHSNQKALQYFKLFECEIC